MLIVVREQEVVQERLEKVGAALRDARLKAGLTQGEVGEQAGVSRQLVSRIEQGCNGEISAYLAVATALRLGVAMVEEVTDVDGRPGDVKSQRRLF